MQVSYLPLHFLPHTFPPSLPPSLPPFHRDVSNIFFKTFMASLFWVFPVRRRAGGKEGRKKKEVGDRNFENHIESSET
jgi:hypothetical protein